MNSGAKLASLKVIPFVLVVRNAMQKGAGLMLKNCSNCKHGRWVLTPTGRIKKGESGRCAMPTPAAVTVIDLPDCVQMNGAFQRFVIWPDKGNECVCFEPIEGKPAALDVSEVESPGIVRIEIVNAKGSND